MNLFGETLRDRLSHFDNPAALAREIGISKSHMSRLLAGKVKPGKKVLDYLGLEAKVIYVDNQIPF